MICVVHPDPDILPIPDPGSRNQKAPDSNFNSHIRIRRWTDSVVDPDPVGRNLWQVPDDDPKKIISDPGSSESEMNYKLNNFSSKRTVLKNSHKKLEFGVLLPENLRTCFEPSV